MNNIEIIKDSKFKGIYLSINFLLPIDAERIANNLVWATSLSKVNSKYKTQRELELKLAELYNSTYGVGVEKIGDLYNIEFKLECLNSKNLPNEEKIFNKVIEVFTTLLLKPKIKDNKFDDKVIERQKQYFINILDKQKENTRSYANNKLIQLLEKGQLSEVNIYTDKETIEKVTAESAYKSYLELLEEAEIKIVLTGNIEDYMVESVKEKLPQSNKKYELNKPVKITPKKNIGGDKVSLSQSVLGIGFQIENYDIKDAYKYMVINHILGQGSNSKFFLSVREKHSMAYYIFSSFKRIKGEIVLLTGISNNNKDKVEELVYEQILELSKGKVTDTEINVSKTALIASVDELNEYTSVLAKKSLYNNLIYGRYIPANEMIKEINSVTKKDIVNLTKLIKVKAIYFYEGE